MNDFEILMSDDSDLFDPVEVLQLLDELGLMAMEEGDE